MAAKKGGAPVWQPRAQTPRQPAAMPALAGQRNVGFDPSTMQMLEHQYIAKVNALYEAFMDPMKPTEAVRSESAQVLMLRDRVLQLAGLAVSAPGVQASGTQSAKQQTPVISAYSGVKRAASAGPYGQKPPGQKPPASASQSTKLSPPDLATINWKGYLHGSITKQHRLPETGGAFTYESTQDDEGHLCTLHIYAAAMADAIKLNGDAKSAAQVARQAAKDASEGGLGSEMTQTFDCTELQPSKKAAEQAVAMVALKALCPDVYKQAISEASMLHSGKKARTQQTAPAAQEPVVIDMKSKLNKYLTLILARSITKGETVFDTKPATRPNGVPCFKSTVHLLAYADDVKFTGAPADTKKMAEMYAAKAACDALAEEAEPLEQLRVEEKKKKRDLEMLQRQQEREEQGLDAIG